MTSSTALRTAPDATSWTAVSISGERWRSGPGPSMPFSRSSRTTAAGGGRRLERRAQVEGAGGGEHLDGDDPGQAVDRTAQLARGRPAHRDVVLLHRAGGDRVDRGRDRQPLQLGDDRGLGVLRDHVAAVDARVAGEERRQPVVAGLVEEPVRTPLADRGHVGGDDGEEVEHVADRGAVEVAVGLDPALLRAARRGCRPPRRARGRRRSRRARRCRGRRRAPAASSAASRRPGPGCSPGRGARRPRRSRRAGRPGWPPTAPGRGAAGSPGARGRRPGRWRADPRPTSRRRRPRCAAAGAGRRSP